jgi:hypothetical protein
MDMSDELHASAALPIEKKMVPPEQKAGQTVEVLWLWWRRENFQFSDLALNEIFQSRKTGGKQEQKKRQYQKKNGMILVPYVDYLHQQMEVFLHEYKRTSV